MLQYTVQPVATHRSARDQPSYKIHPELILNMICTVAIGILCFVLNVGDSLVLEEGGVYHVTVRRSAIFLTVILEILPNKWQRSSVFCRMSLYHIAFPCASRGNKVDFASLQNEFIFQQYLIDGWLRVHRLPGERFWVQAGGGPILVLWASHNGAKSPVSP